MIKNTLISLGFTNLIDASNGVEAIEKVDKVKPDLVLMDLQMPEMTGVKATKIIQENNPTPVVILTAFETSTLLQEAINAGASAYLVKPLKRDLVIRVIYIAIARHKDLMEVKELNKKLELKNKELQKAIKEIEILQTILPICSKCKSVRDSKGYWSQVEEYISSRSEIQFTHSICDNCSDEMYGSQPWYNTYKEKREKKKIES